MTRLITSPLRSLSQQCSCTPQNRSLAVEVSHIPFAVKIILEIILLVGAFTHVADISILV